MLLAIYRAFQEPWDRLPAKARQLVMFVLVVIGWVFFRSLDFAMATWLLKTMFVPQVGVLVPDLGLALVPLLAAAWWGMAGPNPLELDYRPRRWKTLALAVAFGVCLALIAGDRFSPFLYFQF